MALFWGIPSSGLVIADRFSVPSLGSWTALPFPKRMLFKTLTVDKATGTSPTDTTLLHCILHECMYAMNFAAQKYSLCTPEYRVYIIGGLITSWYSHIQWLARQWRWPINLNADRHKLGMFNTKATGPQSSWRCIAPRTICIVWGLIARVLKLIGKDWEKRLAPRIPEWGSAPP